MKKWIEAYFSFTKRERIGIFVLVVLICIMSISPFFFPYLHRNHNNASNDDITKELEDGEELEVIDESLDENSIDISIQLDYEDYIKEYILKQKYDNDKFKDGILNEYDEIIGIYKENFNDKQN